MHGLLITQFNLRAISAQHHVREYRFKPDKTPSIPEIFALRIQTERSIIGYITTIKTQTFTFICGTLLFGSALVSHAAESRDEKVRNDKSSVESTGLWIYNNLDLAIAEAKRDGKPLLVTFRCIP